MVILLLVVRGSRMWGLAVGGDQDGVVEEPVEHGSGGGLLGQKAAPVLEWVVRRQPDRPAFVSDSDDEPEQQLAAGRIHRDEPELSMVTCGPQQGADGAAEGVVGRAREQPLD